MNKIKTGLNSTISFLVTYLVLIVFIITSSCRNSNTQMEIQIRMIPVRDQVTKL